MILLLWLACTAEAPKSETPPPTAPPVADTSGGAGLRAARLAAKAKEPAAFAAALAEAKLDQAGFEALLYEVAKDPTQRAAYIAAVP